MKKRIVIVQPILTPYAKARFEELAKDINLDIFLFVEKQSFDHRPGWYAGEVKGCNVVVMNSYLKKEKVANLQHRYTTYGIRSIPYRLPILIAKYRPRIVLVCNATELALCYPLKTILNYKIGLFVEDTLNAVSVLKSSNRHMKSFIYRRADFYLPLSDESVSYLKSIKTKQNLYRTSWSIDFEHFSHAFDVRKCQLIRKELGLRQKLAFLFVGQLIPRKGILNLICAWKELSPNIKDELALVIIGTGLQEDEILRYVNRNKITNIFMLGHKSYEEMVHYYHSADVLIFPTLQDVFGIVVMEAMASGLPILISIYAGARELVTESKNGYLFDATNIINIKQAIMKAYREKEKLCQMGEASLEIIRNYAHKRIINDFRETLYSVLQCNNNHNQSC